MKFKFSLKSKEISAEADVERLVEKGMEYNAQKPVRKTRYQIRQEEKRKNKELEYKQRTKYLIGMGVFLMILLSFAVFMAILEG